MNHNELFSKIPLIELFNNAQVAAIIIMDKFGFIKLANRGVLRSYGYEPKDLVGKYFDLLFTYEDRLKNLPESELIRVLTQHTTTDQNYVLHKDGSPIWSHGETIYTENDEGEIFLIKIFYDINQQKILEKFLIQANEELRISKENIAKANLDLQITNEELNNLNKELDNFVYTASHDLKAPINNIEALITNLEEELSDQTQKQSSHIMEMLKVSIGQFKNTLQDMAKMGKDHIISQGVYISELIEEIKMALKDETEVSKTIFIEDFDNAPYIRFRKKDLKSILYNLISNAIKYRSPDRNPEISVKTSRENDLYLIEVADNGLGIKPEHREKIFDIYERAHDHVEGTGVGLNIIKRIVDTNGGKIELVSEPGKGSTFKVFLKEAPTQ